MKISVALCTYNGEKFIEKQLQSILNQSTPVDEILICDDRSIDDTQKICRSFQTNYPDIINLNINEENLGPRKNFEQAIQLATGDIIFLADQDDLWPDNKIFEITETFKGNPGVKGIFTNGVLIDENDDEKSPGLWNSFMYTSLMQTCLKRENMFEMMLKNGPIVTGATLVITKAAKKDILPFRNMDVFWHDEWIGYKLATLNALLPYNRNLFKYRIHEKQQVGIYIANFEQRSALRERFFTKQFRQKEEKIYIVYIYNRLESARTIISHFPEMNNLLQSMEAEFKSEKKRSLRNFNLLYRKALLLKWVIEKRYETSWKDFFSM